MSQTLSSAVVPPTPTKADKPHVLMCGLAALGGGMATNAITHGDWITGAAMLAGSEMLINKTGGEAIITRGMFYLGISAVALGSAVSNYMAGNTLGALNGAVLGVAYGARSLYRAMHPTPEPAQSSSEPDMAPTRRSPSPKP